MYIFDRADADKTFDVIPFICYYNYIMVFWIIWLILGVIGLICFTVLVIPKIMFKAHAATLTVRSKAVDRVKDRFGYTVVYVPSATVRRYIGRYSVGHDEEGLFFQGELMEKVAYIQYELTVYGKDNDVIQILRVEEKFNDSGKTSLVRLPKNTDYVGIRLICVDDYPIPAERRRFNSRYLCWLTVLCACLVATTDLLVWLIVSFILRCMDRFSMILSLPASVWAALLGFTALGSVLITCSLSLGAFFLRRRGDVDER